MRIVFIDKCYSNLWYSWYLCREMSNLARNPGKLTFYGPKGKSWAVPPGYTLLKGVWSSYLYPFQIFREIAEDKPDVAHVQFEFGTFGYLLSSLFFPFLLCLLKLSGLKVVITIHETIPRHWKNHVFQKYVLPERLKPIPVTFFKVYLVLMYKAIGLFSHKLIVHGHVFRRILIDEYKVDENKIEVIPHGIDSNCPENSLRIDYWKDKLKSRRTILCFGVFSAKKGLDDLIKAYGLVARKDPDYMLIMAGECSTYYPGYDSKVRSLVKKEGLNEKVMFTGFVSSEDACALFSLAEIIVLPHAVSFSASGSLSLAAHFGKPIVATATPYFSETLNNRKEALLVPPNNIRSLAQALETLLHDNELRNALSENIRLKSKRLSWRTIAESTIELYRNTCKCA